MSGQQLSQVSGVVSDPSGAVIPNAGVRLESITRGVSRETTTDSEGRYIFPQVQPDTYKIVAKASGFNEVIVNNVVLQIATPTTVNITFEKIGTVSEVVSVAAEATQVNTSDATLGNTIGTTAIVQLPSFARNVAGLLALQPGVNTFGNVNGGKTDQANVTLDGVDVNDQMERSAFTSVLRVTLDSVQEFRTTTTNANAEQGRSSGAQVALVTRSGTNQFHGAAYWYHRNTIHAANSFFNNVSGVKRPALLINIPGAAVGGPIIRNRFFFFTNWEQRNDRSAANVSRTVPSDLLRQGIVQYRNTAGQLTQLGPAEIRARIDPAGIGVNQAVLDLFKTYPVANDFSLGDGLNFVGYRFTAPIALRFNTYIAKFDYVLNSKNNLSFRGQLQNDRSNGVPQFPGEPPNNVNLTNAKGIAAAWNWVVSPSFVSTFRYGLTRRANETTGIQSASAVSFRNLSDRYGLTTGISRIIPVHQISDDFAWQKGSHDLRLGGVARWISNRSNNFGRSFHSAVTNLSWLRGTGSDLQPPDLSAGDRIAYGDAMVALLGIVTQGTARWNYTIDGKTLPVGAPIARTFNNQEYELYVNDTWRVKRNLTLTYGLRWSLMPPIYEANGVQVSTDIPLAQWFNTRGGLMDAGRSQKEAGLITFVRHDDPKGRPIYPFHKDNFAPRVAVAWSPEGDSGLKKLLFGGPGRTSIRAGWGLFYDIIGQPLARTFDSTAFGFATNLVNPSGQVTSATAPRFTGVFNLPSALIRPAPPGGFPVQFPASGTGSFAITNSIDDALQMPYTMNMNFSIGREFGDGWYIQGAYVSRLSRKSLINRDLAMPSNLTDPSSGQTYYEAASALAALDKQRVPTANVPRQPFWENFFGNLAGDGLTATQAIYDYYRLNYRNDFMSVLADLDQFNYFERGGRALAGCSRLGCNLLMNSQFSALSAWSSIAGGNYHSMQWTLRKRYSNGLLLDFNYTFSKSTDLASVEENSGSFSGFLVNSWNPSQRRAVSDYDQRHIYSTLWVYELPLGKGKKWGGSMPYALDLIAGGWQISGIWTQSTELPVSVGNGRNWPTNWNITGWATPTGPTTPSTKTRNAPAVSGRGGPNIWADPNPITREWDYTLPGQTGSRNTVRVDGRSNVDLAIAKRFVMPFSEQHSIQFRWETFNVGNIVRFGSPNLDLGNIGNFGKYTGQANSPRQMQFALRYEF